MLDDYSFEQRRGYSRIPDAFWINDDDRSFGAHAEARRLASLHSLGPEEKVLSLQQLGEERVELTPAAIVRPEAARANENVATVGL